MRLRTLGARCVALCALFPVVMAVGSLVSADEPIPALITFDDGAEPPRVSRRVNCLSQAAIADSRSGWS